MATLTSQRRALGALAFALAAAWSAGCSNPFEPAKPEIPTVAPVVPNFATWDGLVSTLEAAIENKGISGRLAYDDALPDSTTGSLPSFYAVHDPAVQAGWRLTAGHDPPDPWDTKQERLFFDYLVSRRSLFIYQFEWAADGSRPIDAIDEGAGTALVHRHYVLRVIDRPPPSTSISDTLAIGYADLSLQRIGGRWYMIRWEDRVDPAIGVNPSNLNARTMGWRRLDSSSGL